MQRPLPNVSVPMPPYGTPQSAQQVRYVQQQPGGGGFQPQRRPPFVQGTPQQPQVTMVAPAMMPPQFAQQRMAGAIPMPPMQPHMQMGVVPNMQQQQQARRKRRFADRMLTPEVRQLVPEAEAYMSLLSFEQKLDATLARKKLDIQEALKRPMKVRRKLRIFVSHSFIPGKDPEPGCTDGQVPMWELRVEGRLLDEPPKNGVGVGPPLPPQPKRKFSSFFKSLVIELDKDIYGPDNHLVEWHRTPQTNETDGFQVKRPGDRDVKCTILLLLDHQPMKFKLHARLAKLLGIAMETRPKITEALWQYIKSHRLQDSVDRDVIVCDTFLEQVFGCKRMRFMEIPQRLSPLLQQPDPLVLNHTIRYDHATAAAAASGGMAAESGKNTACYDIDVEMEDPTKLQMSSFIQSHTNAPEITALDQKIYELVEQINEHKTRRDFYARFADDPQEFVQKWLVSQSRDLKNITEISQDFETERTADHYNLSQTQEGVYRYIYGRVLQKRLELEQTLGIKHN